VVAWHEKREKSNREAIKPSNGLFYVITKNTMIQPLNDRVLIRKTVKETKTAAGIELVQHAKTTENTTTSTGTIEAVGKDIALTVGTVVIFDEGWGNEVEPSLYLIDVDKVKAVIV